MNTTGLRVQGLDNDEVAADWPAISAGEVAWLGRHFAELAGGAQLRWHSPRPFSAAAIIESRQGRFFVKRHHCSVRTAADLREEHHFIGHLAGAGVPVVQVLQDSQGATALEHEGWSYELQAQARGRDLYRDVPSWTPLADLDQAREAGRTLARLHQASAGYRAPPRSTHLLVARDDLIRADDPLAMLAQQLPQRPALAAYLARQRWQDDLRRALLRWHAAIAGRLRDEPRLWAHNDWHVSNLLWRGTPGRSAVATVLDFGLASPTSALFDLATAIERNAVAWLALGQGRQAVHLDVALALLDGYRQVHAVPAARIHLLADLLPLVHFDFALSEVEYFHGVTASVARADVAYHTFLLGHADWFASPDGRWLLEALHAAA